MIPAASSQRPQRALVLGTNAGQADLIRYLMDAGWEVHACSRERAEPGCSLAHHCHPVDVVDVQAVTRLALDVRPQIVYTISSDLGIRTATTVSEELGLPTLLDSKTVDLFHQKDHLRAFLDQIGIDTVRHMSISSPKDASAWQLFPCVVKPVDSQGQRGLHFVEDQEVLPTALKHALRHSSVGRALVEEYLQGVEISVNVVVQDSKAVVADISERLVHEREYFGLPRGHAIPVRSLGARTLAAAHEMISHLLAELQIKDAVLYIQMKVGPKGPAIIEIAPRLDGCHIWRLLHFAKGYDLRQLAVDCLTRTPIDPPVTSKTSAPFTLLFHQMKTGQVFDALSLPVPADALFNEYRYSSGEEVLPVNGTLEVVGYYVVER